MAFRVRPGLFSRSYPQFSHAPHEYVVFEFVLFSMEVEALHSGQLTVMVTSNMLSYRIG